MNLTLADTAQLVAISVAVLLVFWRGAAFKSQLTQEIRDSETRLRQEIRDSETRLRQEIRDSETKMRAENSEAHAGITRNIEDVKQDVREIKQDVRMVTQHLLNRTAPPDG